jgi:TonB-dependent starch-binding outer membrane protein SusC
MKIIAYVCIKKIIKIMQIVKSALLQSFKITVLCMCAGTYALAQQISGVVKDAQTKETLPGVTVRIKNTDRGISTAANGSFAINASTASTLVFSYIGYQTQELLLNPGANIEVLLNTSETELSQVVVVGYGSQRKADITGATSSIKGDELRNIPVMTPTQALQGRVAGVQIISSGRPGSSPTIRVRGTGTALAGTSTLFVVDGVLTDDISNINNADITNVDILKDASSTAIYGARGANGVVIITTKRGQTGKLKLDYSLNTGLRQASNLVPLASAAEYANYVSAATGKAVAAGSTSTDWYGQILRNAYMQNHSLSMAAGSETNKFFLSLGYLADQGIVLNSNFKRFTARLNNDFNINKYLNAGLSASFANSTDNLVNLGAAYNNAYRAAPIIESKNQKGQYGNTSLYQNVGNPILDIENNKNVFLKNRFQSSAFVEATLFKNIRFRSSIGGDLQFGNQNEYNHKFDNDTGTFIQAGGNQRNPNSNLSTLSNNSLHWVFDNILTYQKNIDKHNITMLVGTTAERFNFKEQSAFRKDVPAASNLWYLNAGNANSSTNRGNGDLWARNSYLGRLNYNYNDTYLLTATLRRDGSSRFPIKNRWGLFPSVGLGWVLSNEAFMANQNVFQTLKLRASWGQVGNDRIPSDGYLVTVDQNQAYPFGGGVATPGVAITQIKDANLKWETTQEADLGLEWAALKGKLQGEIGFYDKKSIDLLINVKVPSVTGDKDGVVLTNAASIRNRGLEIAANWKNKINNRMKYSVAANVTFNKNNVIGLNGGQPILDGGIGAAQQYTTKTDNNVPVGSFYVYQVLGVFQTDEEILAYKDSKGTQIQPTAATGDFKYLDANADGKIDDADRVYAGSYQPKAYMGLSIGFSYAMFDISADIYAAVGGKIYNGKKAFRQGLLDNVEKNMAYNRWNRGSGIQTEPAANGGYLPASTYFVESGDFARLNNLNIAYNISQKISQKLKISTAKIFVTAQNIFTLKKYTGFTPELSSNSPTNSGIELNAYPTTKTLALGLNIGF